MHLQQWWTNAGSFISNFEIVGVCQGMAFYDICFNLLWMTHAFKQFMFNASHSCGMPQVVPGLQQLISLCLTRPVSTTWPTPPFSQCCSRDCVILPSVNVWANAWDTSSFTKTFLAMSVLQPFTLGITSYLFLPLCSQIQSISNVLSATALRFNVFYLSDN